MWCEALTYDSGVVVGCPREAGAGGSFCDLHQNERMRAVLGTRKDPVEAFAGDALRLAVDSWFRHNAGGASDEKTKRMELVRHFLTRARFEDVPMRSAEQARRLDRGQLHELAASFASEEVADEIASLTLSEARKRFLEWQETVVTALKEIVRELNIPQVLGRSE